MAGSFLYEYQVVMTGAIGLRRAASRGEDVNLPVAEGFGVDIAVHAQPDPRKSGALEGILADGRALISISC